MSDVTNEPIEGNDQTNGLAGNLEGDGKDSEEPTVHTSLLGQIVGDEEFLGDEKDPEA